MPLLLDLFCAFFRIGLFTFGGGYAMLPLLQREIVEKKKWATEEEMLDYFAVGQCTPGVIAVNTATFVGFKEKKLSGAIFATLGIANHVMYEMIQAKQMSFDLWLTIKVWGVTALSFLFTLTQVPVMLKNGLAVPEES